MRVKFQEGALESAFEEIGSQELERAERAIRAELKGKTWVQAMREMGWRGMAELRDLLEPDEEGKSKISAKERISIGKFFVVNSPQQVEAMPQELKLNFDLAAAVRAAAEVGARCSSQIVDVTPQPRQIEG